MTTPSLIRLSCQAMGCLCEIYLGGESQTELEAVAADALALLKQWEQRFSHYLPQSEICQLNANAYRQPVSVSPYLFSLLLRLKTLTEQTEGAFDPTAGQLVKAWGLFRQGTLRGEEVSPPSREKVHQIVQEIGWSNVELDTKPQTVTFLTPFVEIHLGAVGKGFIVDEVIGYLRKQGIEQALVNAGGSSIATIGTPPNSDHWHLGIADPCDSANTLGYVLLQADECLSTSGSMESAKTPNGERVCHLFDPRNGNPVAFHGSVSVLSPTALEGDALTTAFFVNGAAWTETYCQHRPDIQALWIEVDEDAIAPCLACFSATQSRFLQ